MHPSSPILRRACRSIVALGALLALGLLASGSGNAGEAVTAPLAWPEPALSDVAVLRWSPPAMARSDAALDAGAAPAERTPLPVGGDGTFRRLVLQCRRAGTLVLLMDCPRALKAWMGDRQVLDEELPWRDVQRRVQVALLAPVPGGEVAVTIQVGPRSRHPASIDKDCPSRNRAHVMEALAQTLPDVLTISASIQDAAVPPCVLRFSPSQFRDGGVAFQELFLRAAAEAGPSLRLSTALGGSWTPSPAGGAATTSTTEAGARRHIPVYRGDLPALRIAGEPESRPEPASQIARTVPLTIAGPQGSVNLPMPVFEEHGRDAPVREFHATTWPTADQLLAAVPEPVLPERYAGFMRLYHRSWQMILELVRVPEPVSGLPNAYVGTAKKSFLNEVFMWDSCFTAMAYGYGWRALPHTATLDMLYSFQQDGGYIPRESAVRDGQPLLYEPDFSPNPPMPAVAEVCIARLTGDRERLRRVYPVLVGYHRWLKANRRLPDGTYWTTGLANGLDNSPSLGDGYPDLTAQMAHVAESLGIIAAALGKADEAAAWKAEHDAIGTACNAALWDDGQQFYATSLPGGGHNPNKVVTGFWPLWAGIVPAERVDALARHLLDPRSFWRPHPVPSLAADSPYFEPGGKYWLGSVWAPTDTMVVKGFQRCGRLDLARAVTEKHLQAMLAVFDATGVIWENYGSEKFERGSWSGPDYSWSISGPIRLLIETLLGIEADALRQTIRWTPLPHETMGIQRLAMGPATISLMQRVEDGKDVVTVATDQPFALELVDVHGAMTTRQISAGSTRIDW
jgi:hypothetical protein